MFAYFFIWAASRLSLLSKSSLLSHGQLRPCYLWQGSFSYLWLLKGTGAKGFSCCADWAHPPSTSSLCGEGNPQGNSRKLKHPCTRRWSTEVGDCPLDLPFFRMRKQGFHCEEIVTSWQSCGLCGPDVRLRSPPCIPLPLSLGPWKDYWASLKIRLSQGTDRWGRESGRQDCLLSPTYSSKIYPGQKKPAFQTWFPVLTGLQEPNKRSRTERASLNWKEYKPRFPFHSFRNMSCDSWWGELCEISGIYLPLFPPVFLFYYYLLYVYVLNQIWGSIITLKCDCCRAVKKRGSFG